MSKSLPIIEVEASVIEKIFESAEIEATLSFHVTVNPNEFHFRNLTITNFINVKTFYYVVQEIIFENCTFQEGMKFEYRSNINKVSLAFKNTSFPKSNLALLGSFVEISFAGKIGVSEQFKDINISGDTQSLTLNDVQLSGELTLSGAWKHAKINKVSCKKFNISALKGRTKTDLINVKSEFIGIAQLKLHEKDRLLIRNTSTTHLEFLELRNLGSIEINSLSRLDEKVNSKLKFFESTLGKTKFSYCHLDKFDCFISGSNFEQVIFNAGQMPRRMVTKSKNKTALDELRNVYEVLMNICDRDGRTLDKARYRAYYLQSHRKCLHWIQDFPNWIVLFISEKISFYGQRWRRTLMWIFGSAIVLFSLLLVSMKTSCTFQEGLSNWGDILLFISPIHSFNFLGIDYNHTNWSKLIDVGSRVWFGYLIYCFIRTTRKYV
ncbi:MAG: hypothetical protein JXR07_20490 [Reichenbachiella sp.]